MAQTTTVRSREVPRIGLGTWRLNGGVCREAVADALALGYRHVDTAAMYGNEEDVGAGLRASGVDRDEVWVATKVWRTDLAPARLRASAEASLKRLRLDRVDLLLIHWPDPAGEWRAGIEELVRLRDEGKATEIGVCNFPPRLLDEALVRAPEVFCDQVELNALHPQPGLHDRAERHDLLITAWEPLGGGALLRDAVIREIAAAHGVTPAQVALRWIVEQDRTAAIPRSSSHERRAENLDVVSFALTPEERARIDALAPSP
jgi:2,5-diketo-D-gluconate reductase B